MYRFFRGPLLLLAVCLIASTHAHGAVHCVINSTQLQSALALVDSTVYETNYEIRLVGGTDYQIGIAASDIDYNGNVQLLGGWNADCSKRLPDFPATKSTVVNTGSFHLTPRDLGDDYQKAPGRVSLDALHLVVAQEITIQTNETIDISYSVIDADDIFRLFSARPLEPASQVVLRGNLVTSSKFALWFRGNSARIAHNTFALGSCEHPASVGQQPPNTVITHNIFQLPANCSAPSIEFVLGESGNALLSYNLYSTPPALNGRATRSVDTVSNSIGFVNAANGDYRLQLSSPAVNAGLSQPAYKGLFNNTLPPSRDLLAQTRIVGGQLDLGAYESPFGASGEIQVTTTNDSGAGSLRAAITLANQLPGNPPRIAFNLTGGTCPYRIQLDSPLPNLGRSMDIDGYSQPGSRPKSPAEVGFDAKVCLILEPSPSWTGGAASGLRVPSTVPATTAVSISGLAFSGFHRHIPPVRQSGVLLEGGRGHVIWGNIFGGNGTGPDMGGAMLQLNAQDLTLDLLVEDVLIGGDPEHRNIFGGASAQAVSLGIDLVGKNHIIRNNYFGLGFPVSPGNLSRPQARAIVAQGGQHVRIENNVIVASNFVAIGLANNAHRYTIQGNRIGIDGDGVRSPQYANDAGIVIRLGSSRHTIGPGALTLGGERPDLGNRIVDSLEDGILFETSPGPYTTVRHTLLENNGTSGTGFGIDIASWDSPIAPGDLDVDGGGMVLQNPPLITQAVRNADGTSLVHLQLVSKGGENYKLDVYRSDTCLAETSRRGNAARFVGSTTVLAPANGQLATTVVASDEGGRGFLTAIATRLFVESGVDGGLRGSVSEVSECHEEGANQPPSVMPDDYTTREGQRLLVAVEEGLLANDHDPENQVIAARLENETEHGTLTVFDTLFNGSFTYDPDVGFVGEDTFQYRALDQSGALSDIVTVTITVEAEPVSEEALFANGFE